MKNHGSHRHWLRRLALPCLLSLSTVSQALVIDGNADDWQGIAPVVGSQFGSLASVAFQRDTENLYFLLQANAPLGGFDYMMALDLDRNTQTGCPIDPTIGSELHIAAWSPTTTLLGDARDCSISGGEYSGLWNIEIGSNALEGWLSLSVLEQLGWNGRDFGLMLADGSVGWSPLLSVNFGNANPVPVAPTGALLGLGLFVLRRRRAKP